MILILSHVSCIFGENTESSLFIALGRPVVPEEMFNWAQSGQGSAKPNLWKEQRGATERFSDVGGRS